MCREAKSLGRTFCLNMASSAIEYPSQRVGGGHSSEDPEKDGQECFWYMISSSRIGVKLDAFSSCDHMIHFTTQIYLEINPTEIKFRLPDSSFLY